jgi:type II secretory pathway component PulL
MHSWLGWLEQAGLKTLHLLPDVLALPLAADGWSWGPAARGGWSARAPCRA